MAHGGVGSGWRVWCIGGLSDGGGVVFLAVSDLQDLGKQVRRLMR
jgi:hypothetical protein